ncbi:MAG: hypothetical protein IJ530_10635 [Treponema sp.]|uniref:hypothetical protein n=1 Tax=Treponema sp. TaxID=166 RepID=UPI0025D43BC6|nr:hypothetical protein [Treponema sp.]MBQ8680203.1 hypothetical protein [Treponema sp.]
MTKTLSLFYEDDDTPVTSTDENGLPAEGLRVGKDKYGNEVLLRFRHGFLDGDSFARNGTPLTQPAVERLSDGHLEYWRQGKLHRDNGEAAVIAVGFTTKEYWVNGARITEPTT